MNKKKLLLGCFLVLSPMVIVPVAQAQRTHEHHREYHRPEWSNERSERHYWQERRRMREEWNRRQAWREREAAKQRAWEERQEQKRLWALPPPFPPPYYRY